MWWIGLSSIVSYGVVVWINLDTDEKLDKAIVPKKQPNNERYPSAEAVEGDTDGAAFNLGQVGR